MLWKREDIIWAAGLFEGEGCISARPQNYSGGGRDQWRLTLAMTDEDVVKRFHDIVKFGQTHYREDKRPQAKKPIYSWGCYNRHGVYALLVAFYPFFGLRRQAKAQEALAALPPVIQHTCSKCGSPRKGHSRVSDESGRGRGKYVCPDNERQA